MSSKLYPGNMHGSGLPQQAEGKGEQRTEEVLLLRHGKQRYSLSYHLFSHCVPNLISKHDTQELP